MKFAPEDGIWLIPSLGIHTFGMLFPIDVVYLDGVNRVTHLVEHLGPFRISPVHPGCASVLELRPRTIYSSHTKVGDQLLICAPETMQQQLVEEQHKAPGPVTEKEGNSVREFHPEFGAPAGERSAGYPPRPEFR
jgi:hypothetical protein